MQAREQVDHLRLAGRIVAQVVQRGFPDRLHGAPAVEPADDAPGDFVQPVLAPGDAILQHVPDLAAVAVAVDLHVTAHPRVQVGNPVPVLAEDARAHRVPTG